MRRLAAAGSDLAADLNKPLSRQKFTHGYYCFAWITLVDHL